MFGGHRISSPQCHLETVGRLGLLETLELLGTQGVAAPCADEK